MIRELGALERAFLVSDQPAPFPIISVLHLEGAPAPPVLRQALQFLQNRHPFLRSHLIHKKGRYYFAALPAPSLPLQILPRRDAEQWINVTEAELTNRIDALRGPLFRCTYLYRSTDARADIIFSFLHPVVDASSVSQFLHEVLTACVSFVDQRTLPSRKLSPAPAAESRFPPAFRGVRLIFKQLRYCFQQTLDEVTYRLRTRGKRVPPVHSQPSGVCILSLELTEKLTDALARRARREGMTLNSVLNAAMLLALNRQLYAGQSTPTRTYSFTSLRPYVQPALGDEELACYTSMLRYTVRVDGSTDFWLLARNLHEKIYSSLKAGDQFVAATLAEPLMKMVTRHKSFRLASAALNYNGVVPVQTGYGTIRVMGLHGFISVYELGPELSAEAQIFNNRLFWDFMYLDADMSREQASATVEEIESILNSVL